MKNYNEPLENNGYNSLVQWLKNEGIVDKVSITENDTRFFAEKETSGTKTLTIYGENPSDRTLLKGKVLEFLNSNYITYKQNSKIGGSQGRTEIPMSASGLDKKLHILYKYNSKSIDVQELLVGALVLHEESIKDTLNLEEADRILSDVSKLIPNIKGVQDASIYMDATKRNYLDLAPSISSSNSIIQEIREDGQKVTDAYWTGHNWHEDIVFLNPKIGNIRDYNSSDIIFKTDGELGIKFYGFSLKKKAKTNDPDPTLINKTITGKRSFLRGIIPDQKLQEIEDSKKEFFRMVVDREFDFDKDTINSMSINEIKEEVKRLDNDDVAKYIKSDDNTFFKKIDEILPEHADVFIKEFLELVFRTRLLDYTNSDRFKFILNTGIGKFDKNVLVMENSESKELTHINDMLNGIYNDDLSIRKTEGKLQAWDEGTRAAKIFYTIYTGNIPIINIEIRYKGSFTAEPQFQAVATQYFKHLFK